MKKTQVKPNYEKRATVVSLLLLAVPVVLFLLLPGKAPGKPRWQENMSCFSFANASVPSFPIRCLKLNHPNHFAAGEDPAALAALLAEQEAVTALVRIPGGEGGADRYWIRWTREELEVGPLLLTVERSPEGVPLLKIVSA